MSVDIIILLTLLAPTFILFPLFAVLQCWLCRNETSWLGYIIPTMHGLASIPVFLVLFGMFAYSGITESVSTFNEYVLVEEEATNSLTSKGIALFMVATIMYHSITVLYVVIYRKEKKKIALRDDLLIMALERLGEM